MFKLALILILCLPFYSFGSGFYIPEQGARATGLGNAYVSIADDASAIYYNPAGLTQTKGFNGELGVSIIKPSNSWENDDTKVETIDQTFYAPQLNLSYKILDNLAVGLGISAPFAVGIEWPKEWEGAELIEMMNFQSIDLSFAIAYRVIKGLHIGVSYDLGVAAVELRQRTPVAQEWIETKLSSDGQGISHGFKIGILYQYDKLRTGLIFRLGHSYSFDAKADFDVSSPVFSGVKPKDQTLKAEINLPDFLAWGISYQVLSNLLISFEFDYTFWSSYDKLVFDFDEMDESVTIKDWEDVFAIRFGVEYKVVPSFAIRAGYAFDKSPIPDNTIDPSLPGSDRHVGYFGLGYDLGWLKLDGAFTYVKMMERDSGNDELLGKYKGEVMLFNLTAGFNF